MLLKAVEEGLVTTTGERTTVGSVPVFKREEEERREAPFIGMGGSEELYSRASGWLRGPRECGGGWGHGIHKGGPGRAAV